MSTPCSASTSGSLLPSLSVRPAQDVDVERADARRRSEQAAAEAGALLVGPVDEGDRDRRRALGGQRRAAAPGPPSRRAHRRASRPSARCRGGCRPRACRRCRHAAPPTGCRPRRCRPRPAAWPATRGASLAPPATPASKPAGGCPRAHRCGRRARGGRQRLVPGRRWSSAGNYWLAPTLPGQTRPMLITFRTAVEDDWPTICHVDGRAFGFAYARGRHRAVAHDPRRQSLRVGLRRQARSSVSSGRSRCVSRCPAVVRSRWAG